MLMFRDWTNDNGQSLTLKTLEEKI